MMLKLKTLVTAFLLLTPLVGHAAYPTVMVLINENNLGTIATFEVENVAIEMLEARRVRTVDQEMVRANVAKDQELLRSVGDERAALALGLQFGADVVIVGHAVSKPSANRIGGSQLRSYEAVVTVKAVRTDNSENIGTASETAAIVGMDEVSGGSRALRAAAEKSLDKLITRMLERWSASGAMGGGRRVMLTVGGVDATWKLKAVRQVLRGDDHLAKNVAMKSYTAGLAVFEISTFLSIEDFSEKLLFAAPKGLGFQILDAKSGTLEIRLVETK